MSKKILIDLAKFRETAVNGVYNYGECTYDFHPNNIGMKDIVEDAMLRLTCRRCEEAPCINVCPAEALEKDEEKILKRATNLCIGCQSCVAACPFGTLSNRIITNLKSICDLCDFGEDSQPLKCMETAPKGAVEFTEEEPSEAKHIHRLNDRILVKEFVWEDLKKND
ncbi:MAG: 4Fe-4S dicluster domain-containing protein [Candidatus Cloacimonadaceae bacterium]|nr:4Fe-4S dicluster domain-containing protein [Candidatus Cloacimonadaceae bacterium]MDP3113440.1 4Fe-4S dicluster domain-containing protein [Candidatus Cloacimonadaceae bacterium]